MSTKVWNHHFCVESRRRLGSIHIKTGFVYHAIIFALWKCSQVMSPVSSDPRWTTVVASAFSQLPEQSHISLKRFVDEGTVIMYELDRAVTESNGTRLMEFATLMVVSSVDGKSAVVPKDAMETRMSTMKKGTRLKIMKTLGFTACSVVKTMSNCSELAHAWKCIFQAGDLALVLVQNGVMDHFTSDNNVYSAKAVDETDILRIMFRSLRPALRKEGMLDDGVLYDWDLSASAFTILNGFFARETCASCMIKNEGESFRKCGGCGYARYCSRECQKKHWKEHKTYCKDESAEGEGWLVQSAYIGNIDHRNFLKCCKPWPTV